MVCLPSDFPSVRLGETELALGEVTEDEFGADGGDPAELDLTPHPLDVVLLRVAVATEGLHGPVGGLEAVLAAQVFRDVRLGAAVQAPVIERGAAKHHEPGGFEPRVAVSERELHALVLADGPPEHDP